MFTPVMLTSFELACGDVEHVLESREGDEIVLLDLDPVSARMAQAIIALATKSYPGEHLEGDVVSKTVYLFE